MSLGWPKDSPGPRLHVVIYMCLNEFEQAHTIEELQGTYEIRMHGDTSLAARPADNYDANKLVRACSHAASRRGGKGGGG